MYGYHTNASFLDYQLNVNHPTLWNEGFVKQATEVLMKQQTILQLQKAVEKKAVKKLLKRKEFYFKELIGFKFGVSTF